MGKNKVNRTEFRLPADALYQNKNIVSKEMQNQGLHSEIKKGILKRLIRVIEGWFHRQTMPAFRL